MLFTPGKLQDTHELPGGEVPAYDWFKDSYPIWRAKFGNEHLFEFVQEEGEVVYVPDNWGHNVLNLEPSVGISKQMGTFTWKDGLPDSLLNLL